MKYIDMPGAKILMFILLYSWSIHASATDKSDGLFVATVGINSYSYVSEFYNWMMTVEMENGRSFVLQPSKRDLDGTILFYGMLSPGRYRIKNLTAEVFGGKKIEIVQGLDPQFNIKSSSCNFAGHLIVLPPKNKSSKPKIALRYEAKDFDYLRPLLSADNQNCPLVSAWGTDALNLLRSNDKKLKSNGKFNDLTRDNDGFMYTGTRLGQIMRRNKNGEWQIFNVDSAFEVLTVQPLPDGTLLAGGEAGLFWKGHKDGTNGKLLRVPAYGRVSDIDLLSNGDILIVISDLNSVHFYRASPDALNLWKKIGEYKMRGREAAYMHNLARRIQVRNTPQGFAAYIPLYAIVFFDEKENTWSHRRFDKEIENFWAWADTENMYYTYSDDEVRYLNRSEDGGQTWKVLYTTTLFSSSLWYVAPKIAYKINTRRFRQEDGTKDERNILSRTEDDGKTWKVVSLYPSFQGEFYALDDNASEVISIYDSPIILGPSREKGIPWIVEYPSEFRKKEKKPSKEICSDKTSEKSCQST